MTTERGANNVVVGGGLAPTLCPRCGGTVLLPALGGTSRGTCRCAPVWVRIWADGGVLDSNPSPRGVYWSVRLELPGVEPIVVRDADPAYATNSEAEWLALREALRTSALHCPGLPVLIFSDSKLIVNQFNGHFRANDPRMVTLRNECRELAAHLPFVAVQWRPREVMMEKLGH